MAFAKAMYAIKRADGLLGGLADGLSGGNDQTTTTAAAAAATTSADGGLLGGVLGGVNTIVNGVTSAVGGVVGGITSALAVPTATSSAVTSSSVPATTSTAVPTSTVASTISSSSAQSSSSVLSISSASSSSTSSPPTSSTIPATTSAAAISSAAAAANDVAPSVNVQTITSKLSAAAATTSATPAPVGFLQNKGLMAGVFTVVGVIGLILIFIIATWFIRRRRHDRFEDEVLDFSPTTHINGGADDNAGYPNSLHRTNSNGSQFSRRAPTVGTAGAGYGYGATQGYGAAGAGGGYGGYYNNGPQMQQAYGVPTTYGAPPPALRPGAPPAQNPFSDTQAFNRSRTPSPVQGNEAAYGGYAPSGAAPTSLKVVNG